MEQTYILLTLVPNVIISTNACLVKREEKLLMKRVLKLMLKIVLVVVILVVLLIVILLVKNYILLHMVSIRLQPGNEIYRRWNL